MNVKKISIAIVGLMCTTCLLAACGSSSKTSNGAKDNISIDKNDAVKTEKKVVNGKEVEEYTMADGAVIQVENTDEDDSTDSSDSSDASSDDSSTSDKN